MRAALQAEFPMQDKHLNVAGLDVGNDLPFVLFGGMNVLESRDLAMRVAEAYVEVCAEGRGKLSYGFPPTPLEPAEALVGSKLQNMDANLMIIMMKGILKRENII